ncbi:hypothetical protein SRHO_G00187090 [Serrasalmus rhombeus]
MEQEPRGPPGPHGIVPRTVRFQWRTSEQGDTFPDRIPFIREVVFGALGLSLQDLVCAQRNNALRFFNVTMASEEAYGQVLGRGVNLKGHPLGKGFDLYPLGHTGRQMVTIHLFNPFVTAEAIRTFLRRGQPAFCRGCLQHGHEVSGCRDLKCKNCLGQGHLAKDCRDPCRCKNCGGEGYLAHSCPRHEVTYATVLAGAGGGPVYSRMVGEEGSAGDRAEKNIEVGASVTATSSPVGARSPAPGPHPLT